MFKQIIKFNPIKNRIFLNKDINIIFNAKIHFSTQNVKFTFVNKDGSEIQVITKVGENLLEIAHKNSIDLEGACEASLACSTCHVILEQNLFNSLAEACDEENDLLDLAYGLTETSRLGCQVKVSPNFEGTKVYLPKKTRNFFVDKK